MQMKVSRRFRLAAVLLAVTVLMGLFTSLPLSVGADTVHKQTKTYDIAVVFDNSGSMYQEGNKAWSRAKYAMEIFASMLDYGNGDKLTVFPMWPVTTDGTTPDPTSAEKEGKVKNEKPVEIRSIEDIDKLHKLFTAYPYGTPYDPVEDAFAYLSPSKATDKWLIVLTDGEFNAPYNSESVLREDLLKKTANNIKVQYLRFAGSSNMASQEPIFHADACDDASLITKLVAICNRIFERSVLPVDKLQGNELTLDLSMNKLIVFVQGEDAQVKDLLNSAGKPVTKSADSGQRKFSELEYSNKRYPENQKATDDTLFGQVVTFENCPGGKQKDGQTTKYTLDYSGDPESIQIFYEPNVKVRVELLDSDGLPVDASSGEIPVGEYTVEAKIVDGETGEDVTNHPLMGNDITMVTKVKPGGADTYQTYGANEKIVLNEGQATEIYVEATYLKYFTVTSRDNPDGSLPFPINIVYDIPKLKMKAQLPQADGIFNLRQRDQWQPIRVDITIEMPNEAPQGLTDEQFAASTVEFTANKDMKLRWERIPGQSAYNVYVCQDSSGTFVEPAVGKYFLNGTILYKYSDAKSAKGTTGDIAIEIIDPVPPLTLTARVEQDGEWYNLRDSENWKPIRLDVTLDGQPMTDEQLKAAKLTFTVDEGVLLRYEIIPGQSAYNVYVGQDKDGNFVAPDTTGYDLVVDMELEYEKGKITKAEPAEVSFEVSSCAKWQYVLNWIIGILLFVALVTWWLTHKVYPKEIYLLKKSTKGGFVKPDEQKMGGTLTLYDGSLKILSAKTVKTTQWRNRKKVSATVKLRDIRPGPTTRTLKINGASPRPEEEIIINDQSQIKFTTSGGTMKQYQIRINNK